MSPYRGRFAPSPTGQLHLGGAATALCAWLAARKSGGVLVMRIEDIDRPRVIRGSMGAILEDLRWLGLDWDEGPGEGGAYGPYLQSERTHRYERALAQLAEAGLAYPCDCSRAEIARVASAPHDGEEGPIYPGTCRNAAADRAFRRAPAMRLRTQGGQASFVDRVYGMQRAEVERETGDFVLRRGDGIFSYQLAVVVDDLEMGMTEVVRGADLLSSTARQVMLAQMLGGRPPEYGHAPLVLGADGSRLAKRSQAVALAHHRAAGVAPERVVAFLAQALGLLGAGCEAISARELVSEFAWTKIRRGPVRVEPSQLRVVG